MSDASSSVSAMEAAPVPVPVEGPDATQAAVTKPDHDAPDYDAPTKAAPNNTTATPDPCASEFGEHVPHDLSRVLEVRLGVWLKLSDVDTERQAAAAADGTREIRMEITRQNNELKKIPNRENLEAGYEKLQAFAEMAIELTEQQQEELDEEEQQTLLKDLHGLHQRIVALGRTQHKLLAARDELNAVVPRAATALSTREPLFSAARVADVDLGPLIGWTFYAQSLELCIRYNRAIERDHQARLIEMQKEAGDKGGLMGKLRRNPKSEEAAPELDASVVARRRAAERELAAVEPMLADLYWQLYEPITLAMTSGRFDQPALPLIRAYLRYGLVVSHEALLAPEKSRSILDQCTNDVFAWTTPSSTLVLYADEYVQAIHDGKLSVSPDEELELNGRGTDLWKADRTWRLAISARAKLEAYQARHRELSEQAKEKNTEVENISKQVEAIKDDTDQREKLTKLRKKLAELRPEATRLNQMAERLQDRYIENLKTTLADAEARLGDARMCLPLEQVTRREVQFVRRMARLSARLKTPYLQFVLRDHFVPGRDDVHTRADVLRAVDAVEFADQFIFHEIVVPNKKRDRRLTVRMSPAILLTPARGTMGLSLAPRRGTESGKLMLPLMGQRQGALNEMVMEILSDFGWDCTIETAGADWITSDTFCAGYANVRWNFRKRSPDSQKRAGIDKKLQDRQNWRRHYALYVASIEEAGKKLFNKCSDVYEVFVKYIGLPDGMTRLSRE